MSPLKPREREKTPGGLGQQGSELRFTAEDITWIPAMVTGMYFYLYMVMDIYSRKIVGWQLYGKESSACAADLMTDICLQRKNRA